MFKVIPFYKPNSKGSGTALQISKTSKGLLFNLARQTKVAAAGGFAEFGWDNGKVFGFDNVELSKICVFANTWSNPLVSKTPQELKFFHGKSNKPKTILFKLQEYPVGSGLWNYYISVSEQPVDGKGDTIGLPISVDEMNLITAVANKEMTEELFDYNNNVTIYVQNGDVIDMMIRDTKMPNLMIGEIMKRQELVGAAKQDVFYTIVNKYWDIYDERLVYVVKK